MFVRISTRIMIYLDIFSIFEHVELLFLWEGMPSCTCFLFYICKSFQLFQHLKKMHHFIKDNKFQQFHIGCTFLSWQWETYLKRSANYIKKSIDQDKENRTWPSIQIIQHSIYILDRRKICIGLLYDTSYLGILQHYRNIPSTEKHEMT